LILGDKGSPSGHPEISKAFFVDPFAESEKGIIWTLTLARVLVGITSASQIKIWSLSDLRGQRITEGHPVQFHQPFVGVNF
jgi:hypothetical protein